MDFLGLHNLEAAVGSRKKPKRIGRGEASGHGKTSGRGHKGQKARKSGGVRPGFEGGQNPLIRRLPKRGFKPLQNKKTVFAVNLSRLALHFSENATVDSTALIAAGLLKNASHPVKVLSSGELSYPLNFKVHAVSKGAQEKIEKAGGKVEIIGK